MTILHRAITDPWTVDYSDPKNSKPYAGAFPSRHDYVSWIGGEVVATVPYHARGWNTVARLVGALVAIAYDNTPDGRLALRAMRRLRDDTNAGAR